MCVCVHVCMFACVFVWCILRIECMVMAVNVLLRACVCVYVCMRVCVYVCMRVCVMYLAY